MRTTIQTIGVTGGGSAGYISALYLKKRFPALEITVIESSKIPVVGVGEATTQPMLHFLHGMMEFPVQEFFRQTHPTLKLGVKFMWGRPEVHHFNSPFGTSDVAGALDHTGDHNDASLLSMLMEADRVPFVRLGENVVPPRLSTIAYHIDNRHFLGYLKSKLAVLGCHHLDREIASVQVTPDGREVEHLLTTDGAQHRFDLYLDCSGFRSLLLEQAMQTPWISYADSLKTNRAIVGTRRNEGEILPYTSASTMRHGWLWNTPMQHEDHLGYVYSGDHCSDDEAFAELKTHCECLQQGRVVKFRSGRHAASWAGNVVAVGNAFAFIEPLESTGIHMILRHLKSLAKCLDAAPVSDDAVGAYNKRMNDRWDSLRWYIALHFRFNGKLDTPFWRECRAAADVSGIAEYLEYFERYGPLSRNAGHPLHEFMNRDGVFSVFAHDNQLAGCGVNWDWFMESSRRPGQTSFQSRHRADAATVRHSLGHRESIAHIETYGLENQAAWRS